MKTTEPLLLPTSASNIYHAALHDAATPFFEMVGMDYDDEVICSFMKTSDGKAIIAYLARLLSYINERQILNLDRAMIPRLSEIQKAGGKP